MDASDSDYASIMASKCLKIQPGENAVIFTDEHKLEFAEDISLAIKRLGGIVTAFYIPTAIRPVERITDGQALALVSADVVIYVLETESLGDGLDLSREVAFRHYLISLPLQYKGRICVMPGFNAEMKDAVRIDYPHLDRMCNLLRDVLADRNIRIMTDLGTDIQFSLKGRKFIINNGDLSRQGLYGNIPAGEIYTAPVEEGMNGRMVIDGSVGSLGMVEHPFSIELKDGFITAMESLGGPDRVFDKFLEICGYDLPATKTVGEFGIGLNPGARIIGNMLLDEKAMGTIHFAFGDSYGLGRSSSKFHTDLLIRDPSILVEGRRIMDRGRFLLDL